MIYSTIVSNLRSKMAFSLWEFVARNIDEDAPKIPEINFNFESPRKKYSSSCHSENGEEGRWRKENKKEARKIREEQKREKQN